MNYRSYADLAQCIRNNIDKIPGNVDLLVGVPRSGLLAALMISKYRNIPVISIDSFLKKDLPVAGNYTLPEKSVDHFSAIKKVLIIDDSVCTGRSIEKIKASIREAQFSGIDFIYCAVYYTAEGGRQIDIGLELVESPRFFEWNILQHGPILGQACVDIDGVVCRDPSEEENDDGEKYLSFIQNVPPRFIPSRGCIVSCFVSTRLEKYRSQTEAWLKRNFPFRELILLDLPSKQERQKLNMYGKFKGEIYKNRPETLFIESNMAQAREIAQISGKEVFCTETMTFVRPQIPQTHVADSFSPVLPVIEKQREKLVPNRLLRKAIKCLLPYGLIRLYQKQVYGNGFNPAAPAVRDNDNGIRSYCPYCGNTKNFEPCGGKFVRPRGMCSVCKSQERDRALFYVFQLLIVTPRTPVTLLHMAPEPAQYSFFRKYDFIRYTPMDLHPELYPYAEGIEKQDALHTSFPDGSFDFIVANHVLEHLDENAFFAECRRLLKPAGKLILTIPVFWDKETFRDDQLCITPELREQYYGQKDHVIRYGSDVHAHLSRFGNVQMLRAKDLPPFGDDYNTNIFIVTFSDGYFAHINQNIQEIGQQVNAVAEVLRNHVSIPSAFSPEGLFIQNLEILNRQNLLIDELLKKQFDAAKIGSEMTDNLRRMAELPEEGSIPVVFITDSGYLDPTRIAISSLLRSRGPRTRYRIYVIAVDLSQEEKDSFNVFSSAVTLMDFCADKHFSDIVSDHPHVSKTALFKFRLPEIFPNEQKILYLDSDMIIKGDLSELWQTDIMEVYAAVVWDACAMVWLRSHVAALGLNQYFNSGMMLLNLGLMRREKITEKLIETKKHPPYKSGFMDQDEFNYVFRENILPVSPKYNCMYANNIHLQENEVACYGLSYREYQHCLYSPVILHITNRDKPWNTPMALRYADYKVEDFYFQALTRDFKSGNKAK